MRAALVLPHTIDRDRGHHLPKVRWTEHSTPAVQDVGGISAITGVFCVGRTSNKMEGLLALACVLEGADVEGHVCNGASKNRSYEPH